MKKHGTTIEWIFIWMLAAVIVVLVAMLLKAVPQ